VTTVAVLDDYQQVARGCADWSGLDVDFVPEHLSGAELVRRLAGREVVVAMRERTPFPAELFAALPDLKLLITTGMRNASIDLAAAAEHGVLVTGTRGMRPPTAELTWALILGLVRPIGVYDQELRSGGWQQTVGGDLSGRTLGVAGLGNQGKAVARVATAFGMDVIAWSPNLTEERAAEGGARLVSKQDLFGTADFVSLHLVLSGRTRGIVGEPELRAMRTESFLVNTSRAQLIDQDALRACVEGRWLAGVALDVYETEPLPAGHWLRGSPGTLLSPHMGYVSAANYRLFFTDAVDDITAYLAGEPIRVLSPR
jgi:phosphoglycerate dehydrogenase-like enzyme